jgi:hypothetical protein
LVSFAKKNLATPDHNQHRHNFHPVSYSQEIGHCLQQGRVKKKNLWLRQIVNF